MQEVMFNVGEVVMFFMENGKLVPPPSHEELTDETLNRCTWGTVESVESEQLNVRTDDGLVSVNKIDFEKVCFISSSPNSPSEGSPQQDISPDDISNIHPVADA